jgi:hypothetical protein
MKITVTQLLREELIWNKELVQIWFEDDDGNIDRSEIKRLEFQYDAIDNEWLVSWIEPYVNFGRYPYLIIHCYLEGDNE